MIRNALSPYEARDIAHTYKDTRDPNWSNIKYQVMEKVIKLKAEQNPMVKEALFKTKDYVIGEMCIDEDTDWGLDRDNNGENHLGKALMNVRKELIKVKVVSIFKDEYVPSTTNITPLSFVPTLLIIKPDDILLLIIADTFGSLFIALKVIDNK